MGDKFFQVLLPEVFEQFLAGRAEEIVSSRLLHGEFDKRSSDSALDKVICQIAVVELETYSEEAEGGKAQMFVPSFEQGRNAGGNVGGKEVEMTPERVLLCKIAQQVTQIQEHVSFLA